MNMNTKEINSIEDIDSGQLPGFLFPKLMEINQLQITPFQEDSLGNICYYLHLNNKIRKYKSENKIIDLQDKNSIEDAFGAYEEYEEILLEPGESIIGQTFEEIGISEWLLSKLENTSSFGRVFVNHASHGFSHPGHGINAPLRIMVELTNLGKHTVKIYPAKMVDGKIVGTEVMRMYIEKLPYKAEIYEKRSANYKLKMDNTDKS